MKAFPATLLSSPLQFILTAVRAMRWPKTTFLKCCFFTSKSKSSFAGRRAADAKVLLNMLGELFQSRPVMPGVLVSLFFCLFLAQLLNV